MHFILKPKKEATMNKPQSTHQLSQIIETEIRKVFKGSATAIELLLLGLLSGLAVLIEDLPGMGKTSLAKALARCCGLDFGRIQFTPDLLPGDIVGLTVWDQSTQNLVFRPGAIMHQFVLADEINRASTRTQSALLEAMQEQAVTVDGCTRALPEPFFLVATQNPSTYSGTFALPEAQLDRFGLCFSLGYPEPDHELAIGRLVQIADPYRDIQPVLGPELLYQMREQVRAIHVDEKISLYIISLLTETRRCQAFRWGASPRAGQHLLRVAQAKALLQQRAYVLPEDIRSLFVPVMAHRLQASAAARLGGSTVSGELRKIADALPLPTGF